MDRLFLSNDETLQRVTSNCKQMMMDRTFTEVNEDSDESELFSTTHLKAYQYRRMRRRNSQIVHVLLCIEQCDIVSKEDTENRNQDLHYLLASADVTYAYCVYVHKAQSIKQSQIAVIEAIAAEAMDNTPSFQYFPYCFFYMNIVRNELQPTFVCLSSTALQQSRECILREENRQHLPKLLWNDPVRRYYNYPLGAIIQIIRDGESSIQTISYRIVSSNISNK